MFLPKDKVYVIPVSAEGIVISCLLSLNGNEYYIRYYLGDDQKHAYFFEEELKFGNS